jgi:hypothetical protein
MLALTSEQQDALAARSVVRRLFIWCDARDPETGDPDPAGYWNDVGDVVVSGRTYRGSGSVIGVGALGVKGDFTIASLTVTLSGLDDRANAMLRGSSVAQVPIEVKIGLFNPSTRALIPPLFNYFIGFVDDVAFPTPEEGGEGVIQLICRSTSRTLTIKRTATRSLATSIERDPADQFYAYAGVQRRPLYFGRKAPAGSAGQAQ